MERIFGAVVVESGPSDRSAADRFLMIAPKGLPQNTRPFPDLLRLADPGVPVPHSWFPILATSASPLGPSARLGLLVGFGPTTVAPARTRSRTLRARGTL